MFSEQIWWWVTIQKYESNYGNFCSVHKCISQKNCFSIMCLKTLTNIPWICLATKSHPMFSHLNSHKKTRLGSKWLMNCLLRPWHLKDKRLTCPLKHPWGSPQQTSGQHQFHQLGSQLHPKTNIHSYPANTIKKWIRI